MFTGPTMKHSLILNGNEIPLTDDEAVAILALVEYSMPAHASHAAGVEPGAIKGLQLKLEQVEVIHPQDPASVEIDPEFTAVSPVVYPAPSLEEFRAATIEHLTVSCQWSPTSAPVLAATAATTFDEVTEAIHEAANEIGLRKGWGFEGIADLAEGDIETILTKHQWSRPEGLGF